jgi:AcrR family transcriptional regulator
MGLREAKKASTREAIAQAAMGLFVKRGFDHVTVGEIAHAANVSEKTVFNYFPTKEDIFFDEVPAQLAALAEAIRGRAPGETLVGALHRFQEGHCRRFAEPGFVHFARTLEGSSALKAKELEVMARYTDVLAGTIRDELRVSAQDAQLAANLVMSVHWQLFRDARALAVAGKVGPAVVRRLRADLDRAYRLLEHGLGALEPVATAG